MTSLEAAALATTDATFPGPSLASLPLLCSAVPSEPSRGRSPGWKAAVLQLPPCCLLGRGTPCPPALQRRRPAWAVTVLSGLGREAGEQQFALRPGALFLPRVWLRDGGRWGPRRLGAGLPVSAQRAGEVPWSSHWSRPLWGLA